MIDKEFDCEEVNKEDLHKLDALKTAIKKQEAREFMPIIDNPISLRDQFAMNTIPMTWRLVEAGCLDPDVNDMARYAYQMADAMLAARGK